MKKEFYHLADCEHLIHEVLGKGGTFRFYPRGNSMYPTICEGRDKVVLSPLPKRLKKYQAVLYKRENGAFVLHRIIAVKDGTYTMRGDHQLYSEAGISREQMIGVVTEIIRGEQKIQVSAPGYRAHIWILVHMTEIKRYFRAICTKIAPHK